VRNLCGNGQRVIRGDRPFRNTVGKGRPLHELEHERRCPLGLLDAVDGGDVGVVETSENLRLPREPGEAVRVSRERIWQDLQRYPAVELGVGGLLDLSHAALAEEGRHVVVPEAHTGTERHRGLEGPAKYSGTAGWTGTCAGAPSQTRSASSACGRGHDPDATRRCRGGRSHRRINRPIYTLTNLGVLARALPARLLQHPRPERLYAVLEGRWSPPFRVSPPRETAWKDRPSGPRSVSAVRPPRLSTPMRNCSL